MRIYLCGPMDDYTEEEMGTWRKDTTTYMRFSGIVCLDPTDRPYRNCSYKEDPESVLPDLVESDKVDIEASDIVLVNYTKISVGTSMEILLGWQKDKHVVVVAPEGMHLGAWVVYHSHKICRSLEDAYEHIIDYHNRMKR